VNGTTEFEWCVSFLNVNGHLFYMWPSLCEWERVATTSACERAACYSTSAPLVIDCDPLVNVNGHLMLCIK
jgi:hypothetical protein